MMKKFFSRVFNVDSLSAWWIPAVLLILIFSLSSCGKEVEERSSKQAIEDCIEREGYDDVFDYLYQNYSFNVVFNEIVDTYGNERITDEVIGRGWAEKIIEYQDTFPTTEPSPSTIRSQSSTSSGAQSWSYSTSAPATRSTTGTQQSVNQETTVYITNTGSKYHKSGCQYLKESKIPISLSNAKARGYTPCSKCY